MLLRLDELNNIRSQIMDARGDLKALIDLMVYWGALAYADGKIDVEAQLGGETEADVSRIDDVINAKIDGESMEDRVVEYFELEDYDAIMNMLNTERHRIYNTAAHDTAKKLGAKTKTWNTMQDLDVRDSHYYLDGITKGIDEEFSTIWGNSTQYPGEFGVAEEDINCRCWLTYK